ncbi:MAG TPA: invasin domain 3-containing protein [Gemmatimonadales bacterium]|nr:invasin domain 3-containing protein [Gemmatimonadales bacterium]
MSLAVLFAACSDVSNLTQAPPQQLFTTPTGLVTANPPEIFSGAGDIATCSSNNDEATAKLLDNLPGKVFVIGDNVYPNGTTSEYNNCYGPTWGRHKARTYPSAGNHDYNTSGASGYYAYFGAAAGDPSKGYYSFNLGAWHVIVLNSNISKISGSAQNTWLKNDLAANQNLCTVAYFHHPLYSSSGGSGSGGVTYSSVRPLYDALYAGGADLVMAGHRHFYERMAPMKPDGTKDLVYGTRHMVVGSGGIGGGTVDNKFPTSEAANGDTRGVLKLYLYDDSYAWKFIPIAGKTFTDSGSTACHGVPGSTTPPPPTVSASLSTVSAAPATVTAGSGTATITVTARNSSGQPVSGATVTLASTGSLNTLTQPGLTDASGVATGTIRSTVAQPKVISAVINGVGITQTDTVTVDADVPAQLFFAVQPSSEAAGAAITPAVQVAVQDQFGNQVTNATDDVTMTIGFNPTGGTLSGTTTIAAVGGIATFSNLSIGTAGTGYKLHADATGLAGVMSAAFNITAAQSGVSPSLSTVTAAPATITAGAGNVATITVTAKNGSGNPISGATVTLASSGSDNTLTQPAATTNASGVATGTISSTRAEPKVISATISGIGITQTATVTVVPGASAALGFTVQPSTTAVGATIAPAVQVTVQDQFGNRITNATDNVTLAIGVNPGGGTLSGTNPVAAVGGVATFNNLSINAVGTGYKLTAAATGLTGVTSAAFDVTTASAGISATLLTGGNDLNNLSTYTTGSISPSPNKLVTIAVSGVRSYGASPSPTVTGGGMSSWTEVASVVYDPEGAPLRRMTVYRAMSAAPGSGPITITWAGSQSNCQWIVVQWDGVETSGVNGAGAIGQTGSNHADASNGLSVSLSPFTNSRNAAFGVFAANGGLPEITPGAGFTELNEQTSNESKASDLQAEWATFLNTIGATWSNKNGAALGIEIKAKP